MKPFDRIFQIAIKPWIILSFILCVLVVYFYFDQPIAYYFHSAKYQASIPTIKWLTKLGAVKLYLYGLFILAIYFRYFQRNKIYEQRCWFLWICVLVSNMICVLLKATLGRARPDMLFKYHLYGFYGFHRQSVYWSFPSGHTTTVMSFVIGLSVLFPRYWYAFILSGLMVVFSRILLTYHYLSDVMVATYLVIIEVGILLLFFRRKGLFQGCKL